MSCMPVWLKKQPTVLNGIVLPGIATTITLNHPAWCLCFRFSLNFFFISCFLERYVWNWLLVSTSFNSLSFALSLSVISFIFSLLGIELAFSASIFFAYLRLISRTAGSCSSVKFKLILIHSVSLADRSAASPILCAEALMENNSERAARKQVRTIFFISKNCD